MGNLGNYLRAVDLKHKISELEIQNSELRRLLKLAVEGFDFIDDNFGCAGCHGGWEKCPYNNQGEVDYCTDQWKYRDEAMKLIGDDE